MVKIKLPIAIFLLFATFQLSFAQPGLVVTGNISTEAGIGVEGVLVSADGGNGGSAFTDANGNYELSLEEGIAHTISPFSNDAPLNGVSTLDLVLTERHTAGTELFTSPYQLIAADVDRSNEVDLNDLLTFENAILGITFGFPNNTSWRFVDADYVFPNPLNPFAEQFPEVVNLNGTSGTVANVDFVAVKTGDVNGTAIANTSSGNNNYSGITGNVFNDLNDDCLLDNGDAGLAGWIVVASGDEGTFFGTSSSDGNYFIAMPDGTYNISLVMPNDLWTACTPTFEDVVVEYPSAQIFDFPVQATASCPFMEVDMATWLLRRCFPGTYSVNYCNTGTIDANAAQVVVELDPFFENVQSTPAWTSVNGNTYTFDLGTVASGECGSIYFSFDISCDAELGQTHCSSATVYPNTPCPPSNTWDGANLQVTGDCSGGEVIFTVTNVGEDMQAPVNYVVIEDIMIQMSADDLLLNSGESVTIPRTANGSTWRLMVNEDETHPYDVLNSVAVEGCGTNSEGEVSLGFVTQYSAGDEEPYLDIDCTENVGSWDPNDKQGFPRGTEDAHYIEKGQDIEYLIRFQNTGSDTAFNVRVIDRIEAGLDAATIRPGASSHPYKFDITDEGLVIFSFNNIMLPDSNVNEAASHGFVKFTIQQEPDLPLGTTLENEAAIYFDFNEPVITNRTLHTIGEKVVTVSAQEVFVPGVDLNVYPNPFDGAATFEIKGMDILKGELKLYNLNGQLMKNQLFQSSSFRFDGSELPEGMYFFRIENENGVVASGKVVK